MLKLLKFLSPIACGVAIFVGCTDSTTNLATAGAADLHGVAWGSAQMVFGNPTKVRYSFARSLQTATGSDGTAWFAWPDEWSPNKPFRHSVEDQLWVRRIAPGSTVADEPVEVVSAWNEHPERAFDYDTLSRVEQFKIAALPDGRALVLWTTGERLFTATVSADVPAQVRVDVVSDLREVRRAGPVDVVQGSPGLPVLYRPDEISETDQRILDALRESKLQTAGSAIEDPQLAVDPQGNVLVVWTFVADLKGPTHPTGLTSRFAMSRRFDNEQGTWGTIERVPSGSPPASDYAPKLVSAGTHAVLGWFKTPGRLVSDTKKFASLWINSTEIKGAWRKPEQVFPISGVDLLPGDTDTPSTGQAPLVPVDPGSVAKLGSLPDPARARDDQGFDLDVNSRGDITVAFLLDMYMPRSGDCAVISSIATHFAVAVHANAKDGRFRLAAAHREPGLSYSVRARLASSGETILLVRSQRPAAAQWRVAEQVLSLPERASDGWTKLDEVVADSGFVVWNSKDAFGLDADDNLVIARAFNPDFMRDTSPEPFLAVQAFARRPSVEGGWEPLAAKTVGATEKFTYLPQLTFVGGKTPLVAWSEAETFQSEDATRHYTDAATVLNWYAIGTPQ